MKTYIYGLIDPRTNKIRYIGQTIQPPKYRLNNHLSEVKNPKYNTRKINWLKSLLNNGLKPELVILDTTTKDKADDLEKQWISKFDNLTNLTEGGNGVCANIRQYHRRTIDKKVYSYNEFTKEIIEYDNIKEASEQIKCNKDNIPKAIHIQGRCKDLFWAYDKNEFDKYEMKPNPSFIRVHVEGNGINKTFKNVRFAMDELNIPRTRKNSVFKVLDGIKDKYMGYEFKREAHLKSDELLESCEANQQPSPSKSKFQVEGKVQRLIVEELDTNKTNTSVGQMTVNEYRKFLRDNQPEHLMI